MLITRRLPIMLAVAATCAAGPGYAPDGLSWIPRAAPAGTVEVVSFGIAELTPSELPAMPVLHVRLALGNWRDTGAWKVDLRGVLVVVDGYRLAPVFVNTDQPSLPVTVIPRSQRRVFDLYYAVPARLGEVPARFEVEWQVTTAHGVETGLTSLARTKQPLARTSVTLLVTGWGEHWYIEPTYPWPLFYQRPGPITHRPPSAVEVTRIPDAQPEVEDVDLW